VDCPYLAEVPAGDFFEGLLEAQRGRRIPLLGSIELTWRCNLHCAHCYITAAESWPKVQRTRQELTTVEFCRIIDEIADEGCLYLLLTGGEPLVRADFWDIYQHAKRRGMLITLFTNGTLLDEAIVDKLSEWPPRIVEISLYGITQATYERVTGIPGFFDRCMRGIDLLLERGIPLKLKTMVMTLNKHELPAMKAYAQGLGVDFRFDPTLNACVDGSSAPLSLRLSPEEVVELDALEPERREAWLSYLDSVQGVRLDRERLFQCGAGLNGFHVDPYGQLSICIMVRNYAYDLRQGSFRDGWGQHFGDVRLLAPVEKYACQDCGLALVCDQCPGWSQMESGADTVPVEYLCRIAHLRAQALGVAGQDGD
jgi:radical SAM protein with 4Fe4S-binding SPASM domain